MAKFAEHGLPAVRRTGDCPASTPGNRIRRGYRRHRQETGEGRNSKIQRSPVYTPGLPTATLSFSHRDDAGLTLARIRDDVYPDPAPSALLFWTTISFRPCADRKSTRLNSSHLGISYAV